MASFRATAFAGLFLISVLQTFSPSVCFLFPDLKMHPDRRSAGSSSPRYRIAVLQQEPLLFANGSGYIPDLMRRVARSYQIQHGGDELQYELIPVASWNSLLSKARAPRGQLSLGLVVPSLELTSWTGRQFQSSVPTLYTTLKLVVSKRKAAEWIGNVDSSASVVSNQMEELDVAVRKSSVQLPDRVKVVVLRGSPAEYLLVRANGYRGPVQLAETAEEAVAFITGTSEEAVLLTDAIVADHIASKYSSDMDSVCPSRLAGSGWIYYTFFGRDEAMISKLNDILTTLMSDDTLYNLYTRHFVGQYEKHASVQSPQQCPW